LQTKRLMGLLMAVSAIVGALIVGAAPASADGTLVQSFEGFSTGTPNGQSDWKLSGPYDVEVVDNDGAPAAFGTQSLRISNAIVSGTFDDQLFSAPTDDEAGETTADSNRVGATRHNAFSAEWQVTSALSTYQENLAVQVAPDRGDGARMSFVRMRDTPDGLAIDFDDVPDPDNPNDFHEVTVAEGLSRTAPHTIRLDMVFQDGEDNDVVHVFVDDDLVHTGTSWEDYYRHYNEGQTLIPSSVVDRLLFRVKDEPALDDEDPGFLVDNVALRAYDVSSTAELSALSLSSGTLSPTFDADTTSYTASVAHSVTEVTVDSTTVDDGTVSCSGTTGLDVGANTVTCTVTSSDETTTKTYTITVNRARASSSSSGSGGTRTTTPVTAPKPPTSTPPVTAPPSSPAAPVAAPVQPGQSGSIQVTTPQPSTTPSDPLSATPTAQAPPAEVRWGGDTFGEKQVTVTVDPKPVVRAAPPAATPPSSGGGRDTSPPPPAATPVGNGLTIGSTNTVLEIAAVDSTGSPVTELSAPMAITIPAGNVGDVPAYSRDQGQTWTPIPLLSSPELPAGQSDGYYRAADGSITIFTRHLTYFGLLDDDQAPTLDAFGIILSSDTKTLRFVWRGSDNIGVSQWVLGRNGFAIGLYDRASTGFTWPRADGNYTVGVLDAAGNVTPSQAVSVFGTRVVEDKGAPTKPPLSIKVVGTRLQLTRGDSRDDTPLTYLAFRDGRLVSTMNGHSLRLPRRAGYYSVDAIDSLGNRTVSTILHVFRWRGRWQVR
jgi:hypothetical protein